jgi:type IV secretion system protein VirB6
MMIYNTAVSALALAFPGTDWLYQFTNNLTALTTANGGALTNLGLTLLSFIALMMLVNMVMNFSLSNMTFSLNPTPLDGGEILRFLLRLAFCCFLETYWVNPLPGASFGLNHLFSYFAQSIVTALDQNSLQNFNQLLSDAASKTGAPSVLSVTEQVCYYIVQIILGLASAILFVINISSFIFYAIAALFGPLFIPLYMTNSFRGKFFSFVETLASFAMIRAVAAAFIFVWEGFMNTFLSQTFHGDYSMGMWLANLVPVIMVFAAFIINMLFIPNLTQAIFGGGAAAAGGAAGLATSVVLFKLRAAKKGAGQAGGGTGANGGGGASSGGNS